MLFYGEGFIEASLNSKRGIWTEEQMHQKRPDVHYHIIALDKMLLMGQDHIQGLLHTVAQLMTSAELQPINSTIYPINQVKEAFKSLQRAKHIDKITLQGAFIECIQVDISDAAQTEELITRCNLQELPLKGIFHLAGVIDDHLLAQQNTETLHKTWGAKALGAWNLHIASQSLDLDYFVLFSSLASLNCTPGQLNYALANSFLDGLATYRKQQHLKALSINWGPWKETGVAAQLNEVNQRRGMHSLSTREALQFFDYALRQNESQLGISSIDWSTLSHYFPLAVSWLPQLITDKKESILTQTLHSISREHGEELIEQKIIDEIRKILMMPDNKKIDKNLGFFEMGMDSLMAMELKMRLESMLNLSLSDTMAFQYPNFSALSTYLMGQLNWEEAPSAAPKLISETAQPRSQPGIAIVGMSGIFPGSRNLDEFWQNLLQENDLIMEIPTSRWNWQQFYGDGENQTKVISGGFIEGVEQFDAEFFNISNKEAMLMDPQQRLLLEAVWNTAEHAGYSIDALANVKTTLFVGVSTHDYSMLLQERKNISPFALSGNSACILVNRVSFLFNFTGPSIPVDTACSSSLVALHLAIHAIEEDECEQAFVGGVNAMLSPILHIGFSKASMLSPDGHCKTFDAAADGYARGEGVGVVLIKPLAKAIADGDTIYAVIKGSAVNHGGHVISLTVPSANAQAEVICRAVNKAGIDATSLSYIEAHGTGTQLGDPREFAREYYKQVITDKNRVEIREAWDTLCVANPLSETQKD